jgi:hypothetical protein
VLDSYPQTHDRVIRPQPPAAGKRRRVACGGPPDQAQGRCRYRRGIRFDRMPETIGKDGYPDCLNPGRRIFEQRIFLLFLVVIRRLSRLARLPFPEFLQIGLR